VKDVVIENPVINSAFEEPGKYFLFDDEGITNTVVDGRRPSSYFVPVPRPKRFGKQITFDTEWTDDRIEENRDVNRIRERVALWRRGGYVHITRTTRRLLEYWRNPERERRLFFCQIEALETAIYITEVARKVGDGWIDNHLDEVNRAANPLLTRTALKMATGSGKTVVMAMLIAWQTLNKRADRQAVHFSDAFLVVTPGITIRDRLRVLRPEEPDNDYRVMDLVPPDLFGELGQAKIVITNFHSFQPRDTSGASKLAKAVLKNDMTETPGQVVRRVCRELGTKKNILVLNDESHHCYRRRSDVPAPVTGTTPEVEEGKLTGEEKKDAERRNEEARIWISGLEAVKEKVGIRNIYDLSATPFFLRGSGYKEGTLFPWVVSDFSLIDAIEAGIVKVPRVPVSDDQMKHKMPIYRNLWPHIRTDLPKKGRGTEAVEEEPKLPGELQAAIHALYGDYEKRYALWEEAVAAGSNATPPVFIVVCNNTNVSHLVFNYVAGYTKTLEDGTTVPVPGQLPIFGNVRDGCWLGRQNTILVDSVQLDSGEAMKPEFKKAAGVEIERFKDDFRRRYPGRDVESITDNELLREVLNTVGKEGRLGESIKCVVSVSMLTEGWDANTVTHIMGVRAFGTQLLCEQVVGRGLRRTSYVPDENGMFPPEYAEVFGVPFSFIPSTGEATVGDRQSRVGSRVHSVESRAAAEITFPRVLGYRFDIPEGRLTARFDESSKLVLSAEDIPLKVEDAPIVGEKRVMTLQDLKDHREQEVVFLLGKQVLETYFRTDDGALKVWAFPQLLAIVRDWLRQCVRMKDDAFPQLLLLHNHAHNASDKIHQAISQGQRGRPVLKPILQPYDTVGSTSYVAFDTLRGTYPTDDKCHINYVVMDSGWEAKLAHALEDMDEADAYVKNQNLGFTIPYTIDGREHDYIPDFMVRIRAEDGSTLNLILEVTGERKKEKEAKVATAQNLWVPAVNNHGGYGRWAFLEITDPWDAKNEIRRHMSTLHSEAEAA
jgi:type III restriction enzyme